MLPFAEMGCGFTSKAKHLLRLRKLDQAIEVQRTAAEAAASEKEECAAATQSKQAQLRVDILSTQKQVAELDDSWGVMRDMYEASKRMKKMREKALTRKVVARVLYATLAKCVKEWAALTLRRKRLAARHEWQARVEDLQFETQSLNKRIGELSNKLHFTRDKAQAARARSLIARTGFRSLGMWFLMWRAFLKVSADERRAGELNSLRQQIQDTENHSIRLAKKLADQAEADERMSAQLDDIVAADAARQSNVVPAVLEAAVLAERITKRQFAKYPSGSRSNGLHAQLGSLRRSGSALTEMRGLADEVQSDSTIALPAIGSAAPLSPPLHARSSEPPAFSPQPPVSTLCVEDSMLNHFSDVEDLPVAPKAHQRSRPFNSRGRTLVQPMVQNARELQLRGRGDLSLPRGAGAMRGSMRRRLAGLQTSSANELIGTALSQESDASNTSSPRPAVRT